jgi:general secretion pathway protein I
MKNTSDLKPECLFPRRAIPVIKGRIFDLTPGSPFTPASSTGQALPSPPILGERVGVRVMNRQYPYYFWTIARSCRGFTLLEIMVAVAIMAIVLVSVYKLHAQTISMNGSARFYTTAPLLAQRTIAEIQAIPDRRWVAADGDFGDEFPGYSRRVLIEDVSAEIFGSAAKDLKKIEVTISFNHNEFVYDLKTYSLLQEP